MLDRSVLVPLALGAIALGVACSSPAPADDDDDGSAGSSTSGTGASTSSSGNGGASTGNGGTTSTSGAGGGGANQPSYPLCRKTCNTPADCVQGTATFDEDNYSCEGNHCVYLGCNDDAECQATGNLVCREAYDPLMLGGTKTCVYACVTPADCDLGAGPAFDADNYTCENGGCIYTGCNSEAECQGQPGNLTCRDTGAGVAYCQTACNVPADCSIGGGPAYDEDNYTCDGGVCVYQGCNDDTECMSLGSYECVQ
jgi:hypothetical protein